jgi:hypothetical protein
MGEAGRREQMAKRISLIAPLAHRPFRALFAGKVILTLPCCTIHTALHEQ